MQAPVLTTQEIAKIVDAIEVHASQHEDKRILGAKLGSIITDAIRPKHLRELGGMRKVASLALADILTQAAPSPGDSDAIFKIASCPEKALIGKKIPENPTEAAGAALWRFFSNPRLACALTILPSGSVQAQKVDPDTPVPSTALVRPTTEDYRGLAQVFSSQEDEPIRSGLNSVMNADDFYNTWIAQLRALRTKSNNLLKRWETLRSEFVANKLYTALTDAGLDAARAAELVSTARPVVGLRPQRPQADPANSGASVFSESQHKATPVVDELSSLRKILHEAIDRMNFAELRELRIPAGALIDSVAR